MTVTETTTPSAAAEADKALKTKHAAMWASGDYSRVADEIVGSLGGLLVEAAGVRAGDKVVDVAAGTGTSALPAARRGATVTATDLTPELLAIGRQQAEAEGLSRQVAHRRRREHALRRRRVRHGAVLHRGDVRPAPSGGRRRAGAHLPAGRHDRRAQLDARGLHRSDVRDHEAVRAAAPARGLTRTAVGSRRSRPRPVRRPGHRSRRPAAEPAGGPVRDRERSSGTSSRSTTGRRSPSTAPSPATRRRSRRWTPRSPPWVTATSPTA